MSMGRLLSLVEQQATAPAPSGDRGKLLYVEDVRVLLGGRKSKWWITHKFAPEFKKKIGGDCAWWERDALFWIDSSMAATAA